MDIDGVYEDLPEMDLGASVEQLQQENKQLHDHIQSLEVDIGKLCSKITEMKKVQDNLSRNISELFNTAKAELDRKDRMISELRSKVDNLLFRRQSAPKRGREEYATGPNEIENKRAKQEHHERYSQKYRANMSRDRRSRSRSGDRQKYTERGRATDRSRRDNENYKYNSRYNDSRKDVPRSAEGKEQGKKGRSAKVDVGKGKASMKPTQEADENISLIGKAVSLEKTEVVVTVETNKREENIHKTNEAKTIAKTDVQKGKTSLKLTQEPEENFNVGKTVPSWTKEELVIVEINTQEKNIHKTKEMKITTQTDVQKGKISLQPPQEPEENTNVGKTVVSRKKEELVAVETNAQVEKLHRPEETKMDVQKGKTLKSVQEPEGNISVGKSVVARKKEHLVTVETNAQRENLHETAETKSIAKADVETGKAFKLAQEPEKNVSVGKIIPSGKKEAVAAVETNVQEEKNRQIRKETEITAKVDVQREKGLSKPTQELVVNITSIRETVPSEKKLVATVVESKIPGENIHQAKKDTKLTEKSSNIILDVKPRHKVKSKIEEVTKNLFEKMEEKIQLEDREEARTELFEALTLKKNINTPSLSTVINESVQEKTNTKNEGTAIKKSIDIKTSTSFLQAERERDLQMMKTARINSSKSKTSSGNKSDRGEKLIDSCKTSSVQLGKDNPIQGNGETVINLNKNEDTHKKEEQLKSRDPALENQIVEEENQKGVKNSAKERKKIIEFNIDLDKLDIKGKTKPKKETSEDVVKYDHQLKSPVDKAIKPIAKRARRSRKLPSTDDEGKNELNSSKNEDSSFDGLESGRVLRSTSRKNSEMSSRADEKELPLDLSVEHEKSSECQKINPVGDTSIARREVNPTVELVDIKKTISADITVNLTHDGGIPVLHLEEVDVSSQSLFDLSNCIELAKDSPIKPVRLNPPITSTPACDRSANFNNNSYEVLRQDLNTSSVDEDKTGTVIGKSNSFPMRKRRRCYITIKN